MLHQMQQLIEKFAAVSTDRSTLEELRDSIHHRDRWSKARNLFDRIRQKTLAADTRGDQALAAQYLFEEACAKSLYNMSRSSSPFDPDSPYWIISNALAAGRQLGISDQEILRILRSRQEEFEGVQNAR